jgi:hypothetical protein
MEEWRAKGDMEGLEFTYDESAWKKGDEAVGEVVSIGVNGHTLENNGISHQLNGFVNGGHEAMMVDEPPKAEINGSNVALEKPTNGLTQGPPSAPAVEPVQAKIAVTTTVSEIAPTLNGAVNGHLHGTESAAH